MGHSTPRNTSDRGVHPLFYIVGLPLLAALVTVLSHLAVPLDREALYLTLTPDDLLVSPDGGRPRWLGALLAAALGGWALAHLGLWRRLQRAPAGSVFLGTRALLGILAAEILLLLPAIPFSSTDVFLYLAQGSTWIDFSANPYLSAPANHALNPFVHLSPWPFDVAQYGPLAILISGLLARAELSPWEGLLVSRVLAIGAVLVAFGIAAGIRRSSDAGPRSGGSWVWATALAPLLLLETAVGAHNDAWVAPLIVGAVALLMRGRWGAGLILFVASAWIKYSTLVLAPAMLVFLWREWPRYPERRRELALGIVVASAGSIALFGTFGGIEVVAQGALLAAGRMTRSLAWVAQGLVRFGGLDASAVLPVMRVLLAVLVVALALRIRKASDLPRVAVGTYLLFLGLGAAWFQPWYLVPLLPLAALVPCRRVQGVVQVFGFSALVGLYGVYFSTYSWSLAVQAVMVAVTFVPVAVVAALNWRAFLPARGVDRPAEVSIPAPPRRPAANEVLAVERLDGSPASAVEWRAFAGDEGLRRAPTRDRPVEEPGGGAWGEGLTRIRS